MPGADVCTRGFGGSNRASPWPWPVRTSGASRSPCPRRRDRSRRRSCRRHRRRPAPCVGRDARIRGCRTAAACPAGPLATGPGVVARTGRRAGSRPAAGRATGCGRAGGPRPIPRPGRRAGRARQQSRPPGPPRPRPLSGSWAAHSIGSPPAGADPTVAAPTRPARPRRPRPDPRPGRGAGRGGGVRASSRPARHPGRTSRPDHRVTPACSRLIHSASRGPATPGFRRQRDHDVRPAADTAATKPTPRGRTTIQPPENPLHLLTGNAANVLRIGVAQRGGRHRRPSSSSRAPAHHDADRPHAVRGLGRSWPGRGR